MSKSIPNGGLIAEKAEQARRASDWSWATALIQKLCLVAGSTSFLSDVIEECEVEGLQAAVLSRETGPLFDWLVSTFSLQGISDRVATDYMRRHGSPKWERVIANLQSQPACPKLHSYWGFSDCRFDKTSNSCAMPEHFDQCSVPSFRLRNGRLNQMTFSLALFLRDVAEGDLVGWMDKQLTSAEPAEGEALAVARQRALIEPLRNIYGVSDKVLAMAFSTILMSARDHRQDWFEMGSNLIVVDTLVHNLLHRTGITDICGTTHGYGSSCYKPGGCAEILRQVADVIDARSFNPRFPKVFGRFIQHALWRYCAADGLDLCNGNRINDRKPCEATYCYVYNSCGHKTLKTSMKSTV